MTIAIDAGRPVSFRQSYVRWFFPAASTALLFLSLVAFWDNLVSDVAQPSNSDPRMVIHGVCLLAWMIFLALQSWLPATGRIALHRRLGPWVMIVGIGVVVSTFFLFVAVWKGWDSLRPQILANRVFLPLFALCVFAAWRNRNRPAYHKRLVLAATLFLIEPVLSRTYDPLIAPLMPAYPPGEDMHLFLSYLFSIWLTFHAGQLLYDRYSFGRFHPVSIASLTATVAVVVGALILAPVPL